MAAPTAAARLARVRELAADADPARALNAVAREIASYQYDLVGERLVKLFGLVVQTGPFAGLRYTDYALGLRYPPKLIGCYEEELHPTWERLIAGGPDRVVNVGTAEGYYAVGLARRLPGATVFGFDTDTKAVPRFRELAALNGVADRTHASGECTHARLQELCRPGTAVVCDIEGAELDLLDPARVPALAGASLVVECHDFLPAPTSGPLAERFARTHEVVLVPNAGRDPNRYEFLRGLQPVQKLLALWQGRPGPTPWLVMTPRPHTQEVPR